MDTEVGRDLFDRDPGLTILRHAHHIVAELFRIGLGHGGILAGHPPGRARSDVTYPCSRPAPERAVTRLSPRQLAVRRYFQNRLALGGTAVIVGIVLAVIVIPCSPQSIRQESTS